MQTFKYVRAHNALGDNMPTITLAIPEELNHIVKTHNEINWSEIARRAMWIEAQKLELMNKLASKSRLTEKDIQELDHAIKRSVTKSYA